MSQQLDELGMQFSILKVTYNLPYGMCMLFDFFQPSLIKQQAIFFGDFTSPRQKYSCADGTNKLAGCEGSSIRMGI
jgi:hypothetical protein